MKFWVWATAGLLIAGSFAAGLRHKSPVNSVSVDQSPAPTASRQARPATSETAVALALESRTQDSLDSALGKFRKRQALWDAERRGGEGASKPLLDAAESLAHILELEHESSEELAQFQAFYLACAKDPEVIVVIRAQCLEAYVQSRQLSPLQVSQLLPEFPEHVVRLLQALR